VSSNLRPQLPVSITVFERGWLSSNNVLIFGETHSALVDSGYCTHAEQTLHLVQHALAGRPLDVLVNTHLHSDHCGGNNMLQANYPKLHTAIPPGLADAVTIWDPTKLTYTPTGQQCHRFVYSSLLEPRTTMQLGDLDWQVHAAPGHDTHSVILFEPVSKTLISADALWENGFGVVFPELEGQHAFQEVADTLDLIEALQPAIVIPGHGPVFTDTKKALGLARSRLKNFVSNPVKHANYAGKVLLKFKLLEVHRIACLDLNAWALATPYFNALHARYFDHLDIASWLEQLRQDLLRSGAARQDGLYITDV
jgi:glyoxylase-like metal-dependent hydrolase (beta-lactamase superfamily II)